MTIKVDHSGAWVDATDMRVLSGGSFRRVLTGWVKNAGAWKQVYTYVAAINTSVTATPSTTAATAGTSLTISGTVTPVSGSIPNGSTVELWNGGTKLLSGVTTTGAYSFTWTPATTGVYSLTVKFVLSGVYQPSQVTVASVTARTDGNVNYTPSFPDTVTATSLSVPVTVTTSTGETPTGNVSMWIYTSSWVQIGTAALSAGAATVSGSYAGLGLYSVYLQYDGAGLFTSTVGGTGNVFLMRPSPGAPTALTATSMTSTSFTLGWTAGANATSYDVYKNSVLLYSDLSGVSQAISGLAQDTSYTFYVVAKNENTTNGSTSSATSTYATGHVVVTDSGTITGAYWNSVETGSWRSSDLWAYLGTDLAQGYYSANPYYGIARFDTAAMRTYVDTYGTDRSGRYNHITCTKLEVYASRKTGSGASASVPIGWYMSNTNPGSGTPSIALGPDTSSPSGLSTGSAGWLVLPDETWGTSLVKGTYQSIAMYYNGTANYSIYYGTTNFKVRMTLTWNYTVTAAVSPTWT